MLDIKPINYRRIFPYAKAYSPLFHHLLKSSLVTWIVIMTILFILLPIIGVIIDYFFNSEYFTHLFSMFDVLLYITYFGNCVAIACSPNDHSTLIFSILFFSLPLIGFFGLLISNSYWKRVHTYLRLEIEQRDQQHQKMSARQQMEKLISAVEAKELGKLLVTRNVYNVKASGHAHIEQNVINGDYLKNAAQKLDQNGLGLNDAMLIFAGYLEKMELTDAKSAFNDFNKNVSEGSSKITLKSIWNGIMAIVPDAVKITEAAAAITKFIAPT